MKITFNMASRYLLFALISSAVLYSFTSAGLYKHDKFAPNINPCESGVISGSIFLDTFYQHSVNGSPFSELQVFLRTVQYLDNDTIDVIIDSALTDYDGAFHFHGLEDGKRYNVFIPKLPNGYNFTGQGQGGSRVKNAFVTVPTCDLYFGMSNPKQNVSFNPRVVVPIFEPGASERRTGQRRNPGMSSIPFSPMDRGVITDNDEHLAIADIGSVWATDYQCSFGIVYSSAFLKRHVGLGPIAAPETGTGVLDAAVDGVYMTSFVNGVEHLGGFSLQGVEGVDLGTVKREVIDTAVPISTDSTPSDKPYALSNALGSIRYNESYDLDAFAKVGKIGYGGMSIGGNDHELWLVNLNQHALHVVDIKSINALPKDGSALDPEFLETVDIDYSMLPACGGQYRPWALEMHSGNGYLGVVCDAELSKNQDDLMAYILRFNPTTQGEVIFEKVLEFSMNYPREELTDSGQQWHPWISEWPSASIGSDVEAYYAQPILSDIEFDASGNIVISLMDRFGHQAGYANFDADLSDQVPDFIVNAAGDVLYACKSGDGFIIEGASGCAHNNDSGSLNHGNNASSDDGVLSVGEYFPYDHVQDFVGPVNPHLEVTIGSSTIHPHKNAVLHTVYDAHEANYSLGVQQYDLQTGAVNLAYQMTGAQRSKANGLGDMSIITNDAPIEIGNYVWIDANRNGIQETFEDPLPGVNVSLLDLDGNILTSVVTNEKGEYYFHDDLPGFEGLDPFEMYHVVIGLGQYDTTEQILLDQYIPTKKNMSYVLESDEYDSDFGPISTAPSGYQNYPALKITTGPIGFVNHSYDFGVYSNELPEDETPCPELLTLNLDATDGQYCYSETPVLAMSYSGALDRIDVIYSTDRNLDSSDLYNASSTLIPGFILIEDSYVLNGSSTQFPLLNIPSGDGAVYIILDENSAHYQDASCRFMQLVSVSVDSEMALELADEEICHGGDVTLQPVVSGGVAPYRYMWSNGSREASLELTDLIQDASYTITVNSSNDCEIVTSAQVRILDRLNLVMADQNVCEGVSTHFAPSINGGTPPYEYLWHDGSTDSIYSVIASDDISVSVQVTDALGCQGEQSATLTLGDPLHVETSSESICSEEEGRIVFNVSNGSGDYTVQWSDGRIEENGSFLSDESFEYTLTILDNISQCQGVATGQTRVVPNPIIDPQSDIRSCRFVVLPAITGTDLSSNAAYFTETKGGGVRYDQGDSLFESIELFIFDYNEDLARCEHELSFDVRIDSLPSPMAIEAVHICRSNSPHTATIENQLDLNSLLDNSIEGGTWRIVEQEEWLNNGHVLLVDKNSTLDSVHAEYIVVYDDENYTCSDTVISDVVIYIDNCFAKLGDYVWYDDNMDGIQQNDEVGIENIEVELFGILTSGDTILILDTTDANGNYLFCDLPEGSYKLNFPSVPNADRTINDVGSDDRDSDAMENGMTQTYDLLPGDSVPTVDAGYVKMAKLGDWVWHDRNADGIQDEDEEGIEDIRLVLMGTDFQGNTIMDSTYTDNTGMYMFSELVPGSYKVCVDVPEGYNPSPSNEGQDSLDSDLLVDLGCTDFYVLNPGDTIPIIDIGLYKLAKLGDYVWIDENRDGIQDPAEPCLSDVMVYLYNCDETKTPIDSQFTANCRYLFDSLFPGSYFVEFINPDPDQYNVTLSNQGNDLLDSDVDEVELRTHCTELDSGEEDLSLDLGLVTCPTLDSVACILNVQISLGDDGMYVVTPGELLTISEHCDNLSVEISDLDGNTFGNMVDCSMIGDSIYATVTDQTTGNMCWSLLTIEDKIPPSIECPANISLECSSALSDTLSLPEVSDNCSVDLSFTDIDDRNECGLGIVRRTWIATDSSGNSASCSVNISFTPLTPPVITWPRDFEAECFTPIELLDPEDLNNIGTAFGFPRWSNQSCSQFAHNYEDRIFDACSPYGYSIVRQWTILDWCDTNFEMTHSQVIQVMDQIAPEIECPADQIVALQHDDCVARVSLPMPVITDNCDPNPILSRRIYDANGNEVPSTAVPVGSNTAEYIVMDACGNTDTCYFEVRVVDPVAPVAICFRNMVVGLTSQGWAYVCAEQLNDRSYDNCTDVGVQIKREDEENHRFRFNEVVNDNCVRITCRDIGVVEMNIRVWDDADGDGLFGPQFDTNGDGVIDENDDTHDNFNECYTLVSVEDKLPPVITCPANVDVNCLEDYSDLEITGEADVDGNCQNVSATYEDILPSRLCPGESISRIWRVEKRLDGADSIRNTADDIVFVRECQQQIFIVDTTPVLIQKLPLDLTLSCDLNASTAPADLVRYNEFVDYLNTPLNPEDDSLIVYDQPVLNYDCEDIGINHSDQVFGLCGSAYKLRRTWSMVDWCDEQFDRTHVQIILIDDTDAPILDVDIMTEGILEANSCSAQVNFSILASDNCGSTTIRHNSPFGESTDDPSGMYPAGSHTIRITAIDECGNVTTEEIMFNVSDRRTPFVNCVSGLHANIKPDLMVSLDAELFDNGSRDNCTDQENLAYQIQLLNAEGEGIGIPLDRMSFDCDDIGSHRLVLIVSDEAGNMARCTTVIDIQDNDGYCQEIATQISGALITPEGLSINHAEIFVDGHYTMPVDGSFTHEFHIEGCYIEPKKDIEYLNGISTLDLLRMKEHILDTRIISNPYSLLAADLDTSQSISTFDYILLKRLLLGVDTSLQYVDSWEFMLGDSEFESYENPWSHPIPRGYRAASGNSANIHFVGYKMGDIDQSAQSSRSKATERRILKSGMRCQDGSCALRIPDELIHSDGFQMSLNYDIQALKFVSADGIFDNEDLIIHEATTGTLLISYVSTGDHSASHLYFDNFATLDSYSNLISTSDNPLSGEFYHHSSVFSFDLELETSTKTGLAILNISPNPFDKAADMVFTKQSSGTVHMEIFSMDGRMIYSALRDFDSGINSWILESNMFKNKGTYIVKLSSEDGNDVERFFVK